MGNLTGWHAVIILAVVLLIFGAAKLPALAKSVGQSVKILKKEVHTEAAPNPASVKSSPATASLPDEAQTPSSPIAAPAHAQPAHRE